MKLDQYGIKKLQYKMNLDDSINKIIEYKSQDDIFITVKTNSKNRYDVIRITDIINKSYLDDNRIEYIEKDNKVIPVGIVNDKECKNSIKFYIVNNGISVENIIEVIEEAILTKIN